MTREMEHWIDQIRNKFRAYEERVAELEKELDSVKTATETKGSMEITCGSCGVQLLNGTEKQVKVFTKYHFTLHLCNKTKTNPNIIDMLNECKRRLGEKE